MDSRLHRSVTIGNTLSKSGGFSFHYMVIDNPGPVIEFFDFATGDIRTVTVFEDQPGILGFSVSPDGRWVLYVHEEAQREITLVENFR